MRITIRCSLIERERFIAAAKESGYSCLLRRFGNADYQAHWHSADIIVDGFKNFDEALNFAESLNLDYRKRGHHALFATRLEHV